MVRADVTDPGSGSFHRFRETALFFCAVIGTHDRVPKCRRRWNSTHYQIRIDKKTGLPILVLSTEPNPVVKARADKLGLPCLQGIQDKWPTLEAWLAERDIDPDQVVYVGNDTNDLPCMMRVGCAVAPADAKIEVLDIADIILESRGGDGVVREICDLILKHVQK